MDRRKEIVEAAVQGIREYLDSTRGAVACGSNTKVNAFNGRSVKVVCADGTLIFADFLVID